MREKESSAARLISSEEHAPVCYACNTLFDLPTGDIALGHCGRHCWHREVLSRMVDRSGSETCTSSQCWLASWSEFTSLVEPVGQRCGQIASQCLRLRP